MRKSDAIEIMNNFKDSFPEIEKFVNFFFEIEFNEGEERIEHKFCVPLRWSFDYVKRNFNENLEAIDLDSFSVDLKENRVIACNDRINKVKIRKLTLDLDESYKLM